ncbi:TonB-dependent receptor [Caenispirillum salinarum AK4]|uniref:TonB-dependent receptor n=2 Tax=Caenispirillum TaxID=414051 RepID=K9HUC4_9PROT|nr:TonB-dependent receptor [Caenispirillum salinarum AK4]
MLLMTTALAAAVVPMAGAQAQGASDPLVAQARQVAFSIPSQPLPDALAQFGRQSGLQVSADAALIRGRTAQGVSGSMAPEEALARMLAGTGVTFSMAGGDTVVLRATPAQQTESIRLAPIAVEGTLVGTRSGETEFETAASVEVYTAEDLEERPGTDEVRDLFQKTPNVVDFGEGNFAPAIRGVDATGPASGGTGFIAGTRPRATLSVDGRPLSTFEFVGGPTGLWDIEQVEVYRGPQTTLQGRNSIAGAIVVQTKDPTFYWEGAAQVAVGTEDRRRASAMLSGPLVEDNLAFRVAVDQIEATSFIDFTGPQAFDDVEEDNSTVLRGKLLFAPEKLPDFTAQLTVAHTDTRRPQSQLADPPFGQRTRRTSQTLFETESTDFILNGRYDFNDHLSLSNTTTYSDILFERSDAPARGQFTLDGPQITNETLLNYDNADAGVTGVLGAYVFHEDREDFIFTGTPLAATVEDRTLTTAVFGEVDWTVVPRWTLTLGARYEREHREREGTVFGITTDLDETFDAFLPKVGLAYDVTDDVTVGAVVSRGFNAGGAAVSFGASDPAGNPSPDPALGPRSFVYDSEFVWNYELYTRASLLDDRMVFSGNVFYSDFEDQQRTEQLSYPGGFTDTIIVNTPETRAYGAELGVTYAPVDSLEVFGDVGLLKTEIVQARDPSLEGNDFARAPSLTLSAGAVYRPAEDWMIGVDGRYVGAYYSTDGNNALAQTDPYMVANAKVAWQALDHVKVTASLNNIFGTDAETRLFSFPESAPPSLAQVVEPRVFWLGLTVAF